MIQFTFDKKDIRKRISAVVLSQIKPQLIIGIISLIISIYFLLVGYWADNEALISGYSALFLSLFMFFICILTFYRYKRVIEDSFNENSDNDEVHYKIEVLSQFYVLTILTTNKVIKFSENEIRKIHIMKNYVIVKLLSGIIMVYPKNEDILKLFGKK